MIYLILIMAAAIFLFLGATILYFIKQSKIDQKQSESILDLERRLTDLMLGQLKEARENQGAVSGAMREQIASFMKEATHIREELSQVGEKVKDVSSFQEMFKAPKLRGQWGEASLEHILSQHFPPELYKSQYLFSSGEKVDFVLTLPDGKILPIDAKFPSENFEKITKSRDAEKEFLQKKFIEDVKIKINEISSKYILPSEGTVDFALMYIPAEAIYYEIVNNISRETDLAKYAWSKKIILVSPNTIYLTLKTIEHWFRDTQISRQTQDILRKLNKVHQDAGKLMNDFRKLGSHLRNASSAYENSEKRLSMFGEKVERLLEIREVKKIKSRTEE